MLLLWNKRSRLHLLFLQSICCTFNIICCYGINCIGCMTGVTYKAGDAPQFKNTWSHLHMLKVHVICSYSLICRFWTSILDLGLWYTSLIICPNMLYLSLGPIQPVLVILLLLFAILFSLQFILRRCSEKLQDSIVLHFFLAYSTAHLARLGAVLFLA